MGNPTLSRHARLRLVWVFLILLPLLASAVWVVSAQKEEQDEIESSGVDVDVSLRRKIDPYLIRQLASNPEERIPIIIQVDLSHDLEDVGLTAKSSAERRAAVVSSLKDAADRSQSHLRSILERRSASGNVTNVRSFWVFNGLSAEADLETILELAGRPEVQIIRRDREYHLDESFQASSHALQGSAGVATNISQVGADKVWNALRFDGQGVVVANVDSGVDWLHPALKDHYRGYVPGGSAQHNCNWFDATGGGATAPADEDGHGTHTMGTIVGQQGIGVAPGAQWIAARAFDATGSALESWLHAALQWMIDPGPGCQPPQIVSNSWGTSAGDDQRFRPDVQALRAAGIFAAFSAGNDGPIANSVHAPASYPEAFSVGAVASDDIVAYFSSRGPSIWFESDVTKPEVSAPGVKVISSLPGDIYGEGSGTSMAAPHAAGLAALMLEANPGLSLDQLETTMKQTAINLSGPQPNDLYGWGRIDAYTCVANVSDAINVSGTIARAIDSAPVAGAELVATSTTSGGSTRVTTGGDGSYILYLAPGSYNLIASAFGYISATGHLDVSSGGSMVRNLQMTSVPTGTLTGRVTSDGKLIWPTGYIGYLPVIYKGDGGATQATRLPSSGLPVTDSMLRFITIKVHNTPVTVKADREGYYSVDLPTGTYTLTAGIVGYRTQTVSNVAVVSGGTTVQNFDLQPAPDILLVDGDAWFYVSEIDYYRQALDELGYAYHVWTIGDATTQVPRLKDLVPYDIVFWSCPSGSLGYIGAGPVIEDYLDQGGRLFLSGQHIAFYDDVVFIEHFPYLDKYLKAAYVHGNQGPFNLIGESGDLLDGLAYTINGPGGAENQDKPDEIESIDPDFASSIVRYDNGASAGQQVSGCLPYRAIYLSHGFESIDNLSVRTEVISRSIDWLMAPPSTAGLELDNVNSFLIGDFGSAVTHSVRVRNTAEVGPPEEYLLSYSGNSWPATLSTPGLTMIPCEVATVALSIMVPLSAGWAATDTLNLSARSTSRPALSDTTILETKAPAPVLLVDDDRWYDVEDTYRDALAANGIPFDEWTVSSSYIGEEPPSPPADILGMYPMVIWFSAYDWNDPLTANEEARLANYLDQGGRLSYSSQDYLYVSEGPSEFARTYLGVYTYTEDMTSTVVSGVITNAVGSWLGPMELDYLYKNFSDALTPTNQAEVMFVNQTGQPNSLTNAGNNWHTAFFAFGPEGLPEDGMKRVTQRLVGWLSWMGESGVHVDKELAREGETLTYLVVLRNDGFENLSPVYMTSTFTSDLIPIPSSVTGGAVWNAGNNTFTWSGQLAGRTSRTFSYQAAVSQPLPVGHVLSHTVWMGYPDHYVNFDRIATTYINMPVFGQSVFQASPSIAESGSVLTYSLVARNTGMADSVITATNALPSSLDLVIGSIHISQGNLEVKDHIITWTVPVSVQTSAKLNYQAVVTSIPSGFLLRNRAELDDGLGHRLPVDAVVIVGGKQQYLPTLYKN